MTDEKDKERFEQNFRDIFSKLNKFTDILNKFVTTNTMFAIIAVLIGLWASMFGLLYVDIQDHKKVSIEQRIEVIRELGEVKTLIGKLSK